MKKLSFLLSAAVAVVSFSAVAASVVVWQSGETPATVADGHVALTYDANNAITSMSAMSDQLADRVIFTGDAMTLAADAVIAAPADTIVFSNAVTVTGNGGVSFTKTVEDLVYGNFETGNITSEQMKFLLPVKDSVVAFSGCQLDEIKIVSCAMYGPSIVNGKEGRPFNLKEDSDGSLVVQMQAIDGNYLKCVYVRFFQDGDDVRAQAIKATYGNTDNTNVGNHKYALGDDFDVYPGHQGSAVALPSGGGNYGVKGIKAVLTTDQRIGVEVFAPFSVSGTVQFDNAAISISGDGSFGPDVATAPAMTLANSRVEWIDAPTRSLTLANAISGTDSELAFSLSDARGDLIEDIRVDGDVGYNPVKIAEGVSIDDIAGFDEAVLYQNGGRQGDGSNYAIPCFLERTENKVECQFQIATGDNWNKCVLMEFTEEGGFLYARAVDSYWKRANVAPAGEYDFRVNSYEGKNQSSYYLHSFKVVLKHPVQPLNRLVVNANAANTLRNSTITIGTNVNYVVNHRDAIPCEHGSSAPTINSKVEVEAGGVLNLNLNTGTNTDGLNNGTLITVHRGGTLLQSAMNVLQRGQNVVLDGGSLVLSKLSTKVAGDSGQYINRLTFYDGGLVSGAAPRIGLGSGTWQVKGTGAPCVVKDGLFVVRDPQTALYKNTWTIEVDDLTGDAESDFILSGAMGDYPNEGAQYFYGMTRRKTGAGTLLLAEDLVCTAITGRWEIVEGTVAVAGSDQLSAERGYSLALQGGTLELKAGTENSFAFFTDLTATSGLTLGENARLELPGAPQNWTADAMLQVSLAKGATLKVGDDASALTPDQLKQIRVNGVRARLTDDGCLRPDLGLMLLIR